MATYSNRYARAAWILSLLVLAVGCKTTAPAASTAPASAPAPRPAAKVTTVDPAATLVDLSGNWSDADATSAITSLVPKMLASAAVAGFAAKKSRKPAVRLYPIRNRTSEHINTARLKNQLRQSLVKSGKLRLLAFGGAAAAARFERAKGGAKQGDQLSADYIVGGWITSTSDVNKGRENRAYTVTLELTDVTSNEIVWTDQHEVKKVIEHPPGKKKEG